MAISDITQSILDQAKAEVEKIKTDWESKIQDIKSENQNHLNTRKDELAASYVKKKEQALDKAKSMALLEWKNKVLKAKHGLMDGIFDWAKKKVLWMQQDKYVALLVKLLSSINEDSWELVAWSGESSILNQAVQMANKSFRIAKEWSFKWWFKLSTKISDYDFTIDNLFKDLKKQKELELSNKLFATS